MTGFWSGYVIFLVVINIVGNAWLLFAMRSMPKDGPKVGESTGHRYDEIEELNNPLPLWWLWTFVASIIFAVGYLWLYPGLGSYKGYLDWTSVNQWEGEVAEAQKIYGPIYAAYAKQSIPDLLSDERAVRMGSRLFLNNCAPCHGSDARGGPGYPNLTDDDWLYGGDPTMIEMTILHGRNGMMPVMGPVVGGEEGIAQAANYVLSLSGREHDEELASKGKVFFQTICFACHGPDGRGMQAVGSANLTDDIWLHDGTEEGIRETIRNARISKMPAWKDILGEEKVHLLALYVYSLSHQK